MNNSQIKIAYFRLIFFLLKLLIVLIVLRLGYEIVIGLKDGKTIKESIRLAGKRMKKINRTLQGSGLELMEDPEGFIFGKLRKKFACLRSWAEGHMIIFGGSGKGKTSALLIPSLRKWFGTFFAIDISGDINANVHCTDRIILSPDDPANSVLYNVFYAIDECETDDEKREKLEMLSNLIIDIPAKANETTQYFLKTARTMFFASLLAFYNLGYDFVEICKTVFFHTDELFDLIDAAENDLASGYISSLKKENEKNINGAKSALKEKIKLFADNKNMEQVLRRPLVDLEGKSEPNFQPKMLESKKVFLVVPDKKQEFYTAFMHIVTGQVLDYIGSRKYDKNSMKRILVALDEFASLGHLELLGPFRKFRKNGANLCVLTQSLADIDLTYSKEERKVIIDNCKYIAVINATEPETKKYFSDVIGKEEVEKISTSSSDKGTSTSTSYQREYAIEENEWNDFKDHLVLIHPGGFTKLELNYYFKS